jgi:MFS family permease
VTIFEQEVERNYRHNFIVNFLDGMFFWFGASFITASTILPVYVSHFTDSKFLLGVLSMIANAGWFVPQLFTANWIQRQPRKKVPLVRVGLFTERLPVVLLVISPLLAVRWPTLALAIFFVCIAWHSLGAGLVAVAWQDMIAKIIPVRRRGTFVGVTNFGGTATGLAGASAAAWVLSHYDFPTGYVWSFAAAGVLLMLSWTFVSMAREPAQESASPPLSQREYLRRLPSVLRADVNFRQFLLSRAVISTGLMAVGFLTVYAVRRWNLPDGQAGGFTVSMLVGQVLANLAFGALADRRGHKLTLELATLLGMLGIGLAIVAPSPYWFYAVFVLLGFNQAGVLLSGLMIALEFCAPEQRPTYIGLNNTVNGVASGLAPLFGGWLAGVVGYVPFFTLSLAVGLAGLALLHWTVHEPRHARPAAETTGVRAAEADTV